MGYNLELKEFETLGQVNIFDSAQIRWVTGGITVDYTKVSQSEGKRILKAGTPMGKLTASGKYAPWDEGGTASDGSQTALCMVPVDTDCTDGDQVVTAFDMARVLAARVNVSSAKISDLKSQLPHIDIVVRAEAVHHTGIDSYPQVGAFAYGTTTVTVGSDDVQITILAGEKGDQYNGLTFIFTDEAGGSDASATWGAAPKTNELTIDLKTGTNYTAAQIETLINGVTVNNPTDVDVTAIKVIDAAAAKTKTGAIWAAADPVVLAGGIDEIDES